MLKADADYLNHYRVSLPRMNYGEELLLLFSMRTRIIALCHRARAWPREKCMLSSDAWCVYAPVFWHLYGAAATIMVARRAL